MVVREEEGGGSWLSPAAATAWAIAGGGLGLISSLSPYLSRCGFFFFFFFLRKLLWVFTSGRTVENKFFNLVLVNFFSHM